MIANKFTIHKQQTFDKSFFPLYFYFQIELNRIALLAYKCNLSKSNLHQWHLLQLKKEFKKKNVSVSVYITCAFLQFVSEFEHVSAFFEGRIHAKRHFFHTGE